MQISLYLSVLEGFVLFKWKAVPLKELRTSPEMHDKQLIIGIKFFSEGPRKKILSVPKTDVAIESERPSLQWQLSQCPHCQSLEPKTKALNTW